MVSDRGGIRPPEPPTLLAGTVISLVFDLATGRPCDRARQAVHGGDLTVHRFFRPADCQDEPPKTPILIVGTAVDWYRMGLYLCRRKRRRKGGTK